jgi:hypothetical protein
MSTHPGMRFTGSNQPRNFRSLRTNRVPPLQWSGTRSWTAKAADYGSSADLPETLEKPHAERCPGAATARPSSPEKAHLGRPDTTVE